MSSCGTFLATTHVGQLHAHFADIRRATNNVEGSRAKSRVGIGSLMVSVLCFILPSLLRVRVPFGFQIVLTMRQVGPGVSPQGREDMTGSAATVRARIAAQDLQ